MIDLNPIEVLKKRVVNFMPVHFSKTKIDDFDTKIETWVRCKLKGRYCITKEPILSESKLQLHTMIGFEDSKELTFFMLACPFYRR